MPARAARTHMEEPPFRLARNTASILVTKAVLLVLRFVGIWLLTVALGDAGLGPFGVVTSFALLLQGASSLGLAYANTCFIAKDSSRRDELHSTTLIVTAVVGALVVTALILGRRTLAGAVLRNVEPGWLLVAAIAFPFALYAHYIVGLWTGEEQISRINRLELLRAVVYVLGLVLVVLALPRTVSGALWFWAASFVVMGVTAGGVLLWRDRVRWSWRAAGFGDALRFSLVGYLGDIASMTHQWFGLFVINHYIGKATAGAYFLALLIAANIFWLMADAVRRAGARRVIGADQAPSWELVAAMTRVTFWTLLLPAALLMVASPWLVPAIFRGFEGSVRPLQVLLPAFVLASCGIVLAYYVIGNRRRPQVVTVIAWVALAVNILLSLTLVRSFGVMGVAVAAAVSFSLPFLLLLPVFYRWGHSPGDLFVPRREDIEYFRSLFRYLRGHIEARSDNTTQSA